MKDHTHEHHRHKALYRNASQNHVLHRGMLYRGVSLQEPLHEHHHTRITLHITGGIMQSTTTAHRPQSRPYRASLPVSAMHLVRAYAYRARARCHEHHTAPSVDRKVRLLTRATACAGNPRASA